MDEAKGALLEGCIREAMCLCWSAVPGEAYTAQGNLACVAQFFRKTYDDTDEPELGRKGSRCQDLVGISCLDPKNGSEPQVTVFTAAMA